MLRRLFLKPKKKIVEEAAHRRYIFKTKYKVHGKFCNLIIDCGSIENMVSTNVSEKLKLKCTPHP